MTFPLSSTKNISSRIEPLRGHLVHLSHLARPVTSRMILQSRFNLSGTQLTDSAKSVSAHVALALRFYQDSILASPIVRPVLQYYCFMNLAVAIIHAWQPSNYKQRLRMHGISDLSASTRKLELSSIAIAFQSAGVIPLFHSIISDAPLPLKPVRVKQLLAPAFFMSAELADAFKLHMQQVSVTPMVAHEGASDTPPSRIQLQFDPSSGRPTKTPLLSVQKKIESAMPILRKAYVRVHASDARLTYRSKMSFQETQSDKFYGTFHNLVFPCVNFGGDAGVGDWPQFEWHFLPKVPPLPTLTACMGLSFYLSSLYRYRATLLDALPENRLSLLFDVFLAEVGTVLIPAFRNILYRESVSITQITTQ